MTARSAQRAPRGLSGSMQGRVALVTGGTGGIGEATALALAIGQARVYLVGRDAGRGRQAAERVRAASGSGAVELLLADLSSQASIRQLAREFSDREDRLDVLINNVGGLYADRWETKDGVEATLAMNVVNPFLLTNLLLPRLKDAPSSRVINVNSAAHHMSSANVFEDAQAQLWYRGLDIYMRAKFLNVLWSYELARRLEGTGITVNVVDPGGASTAMTRAMVPRMVPPFMRLLWPVVVVQQYLMGTKSAAASSIRLASAPELASTTGRYFDQKGREVKSSPGTYDRQAQKRAWALLESLTATQAADAIEPFGNREPFGDRSAQ